MSWRVVFLIVLVLACSTCEKSSHHGNSVPNPPRRIVSLLPSATELVYFLGEGKKLVGVTKNDNFPSAVQALPKVGDETIDMERVLALEPDLVILDSGFNKDKKKLEALGLSVFELRCRRLNDVTPAMRSLGKKLGVESRAEVKAQEFEAELASLKPLRSDVKVFVEIWGEPLMTVGSGTLLSDLLDVLDLNHAFKDVDGYFQVVPEDVVSRKPTLILLPLGQKEERGSKAVELCEGVGLDVEFLRVDADLLVRPGPRLLEGLRLLRAEIERKVPH